jgi:hypothetical protein
MSLTEPDPPSEKTFDPEATLCRSLKRSSAWRSVSYVDCDADRGADATTGLYQVANSRRHVSLRVLLRLTAMDVCCGPPAEPTFLIA